jgi:hypothetical protein
VSLLNAAWPREEVSKGTSQCDAACNTPHKLGEIVEMLLHAKLVRCKVDVGVVLSLHQPNKTPEGGHLIVQDRENHRSQVAHALHVPVGVAVGGGVVIVGEWVGGRMGWVSGWVAVVGGWCGDGGWVGGSGWWLVW